MSVTAATLTVFVPASMLVAASPGANNLLSLMNGARSGFGPTAQSICGRMAAFAILLAIVAVGLGALLTESEVAFRIVKWLGVGYLAYLGVKMWRSRAAFAAPGVAAASSVSMARKEFAVAMTNPKAMLLFSAFIPQFVSLSGNATTELFVLGAIYLAIEFAMACVYALAGAIMRRSAGKVLEGRLMNRVGGAIFVASAGLLATSAQRG